MAKIISRDFLNRSLTGQKLNAKVGAVKIGGKSLRGADLKKFITFNLGGKTSTLIEKALKEKYGLYGSQGKTKKRQSRMELVRGDKKSGLSQEQVKRNLELNKRKDEPGLNKLARKITFAGKVAGPAARTKGAMSDIGVKTNVIGFAQNSNKKPPVDPSPKVPSGGVRPIGL